MLRAIYKTNLKLITELNTELIKLCKKNRRDRTTDIQQILHKT